MESLMTHQKLTPPSYQRAWPWAVSIILGMLAAGALLDSIANTFLLITSRITYISSIMIIGMWMLLMVLLKKHGLVWSTKDDQQVRIRRLRVKVKGAVIGVMVLLWLPRVADIFGVNLIKDETLESSKFYGVIEDENGKLIFDAEIIITEKESETDRLGYGRTMSNGEFDLLVKAKPQTTLWVTVIRNGVIGFQNYLPMLGSHKIIFKSIQNLGKP